eukprot:CAMPEP_0168795108 /NCGR_PEP_ID=MMETSP0725-20121227/16008_1 /TAXON_ID=265536 /ORGANISM="Amphiprora sp., Strain CCMP467" /LENGTH=80 /DNA_ID=CAMNT_0008846059 /DNA_START=228 /DNA_END=467 /DNA_ORIENTATION=+
MKNGETLRAIGFEKFSDCKCGASDHGCVQKGKLLGISAEQEVALPEGGHVFFCDFVQEWCGTLPQSVAVVRTMEVIIRER